MTERSPEQPVQSLFQRDLPSIFTAFPKAIVAVTESCLSHVSEKYRYALNSRYYDLLVIKPPEQHIRGRALYRLQQSMVRDIHRRSSAIQNATEEAGLFEKRLAAYIFEASSYLGKDPHDDGFITDDHQLLERWAQGTLVLALREEALRREQDSNASSDYFQNHMNEMYDRMWSNERVKDIRFCLKTNLIYQDTDNQKLVDLMAVYVWKPIHYYAYKASRDKSTLR